MTAGMKTSTQPIAVVLPPSPPHRHTHSHPPKNHTPDAPTEFCHSASMIKMISKNLATMKKLFFTKVGFSGFSLGF
jgi:hypothetical protein